MTKEELLKKIDFEKSWLYDCGIFGSNVDIAFHAIKKKVIEALDKEPKTDTWSIKDVADTLAKHGLIAEQEPCEDCISRQAVIDTIYHECSGENLDIDFSKVLLLQRKIKALPSVNPQKIGHWIRQTDDYHDYYECEQCGIAVGLDDVKNYCPNCGARMKG